MSYMVNITIFNNLATKKFILKALGNDIDADGYVTDKDGNKVIDIDGMEILAKDLGMLSSGSKIFVKDNVVSLAKYYLKYQRRDVNH